VKIERYEEYLDLIGRYYQREPDKALRIVDHAVRRFPKTAKLWDLRGDLIQLSNGNKYTVHDSLASYRQALKCDPRYAPAYESIGYYHDVFTQRFSWAEAAFRKAIRYGAGVNSHVGLARVLAQMNRKLEALAILNKKPFSQSHKAKEMKREILDDEWSL
jgi:tetratricopeptide (TPR) repeat protein